MTFLSLTWMYRPSLIAIRPLLELISNAKRVYKFQNFKKIKKISVVIEWKMTQ